jgi:protein phosphatase
MSGEPAEYAFDVAVLSDVGTEREHNEDHADFLVESASCGLVAVADGVSGQPGGGTASREAIDALVKAFKDADAKLGGAKRLWRAAQEANIAVYESAIVVPELRGMATTLTAVVLERGELAAAHVGDSRLYLVRGGEVMQLTKDHTVAGERVRMGLLGEARARQHPGRSVLTRSLGRELIVAIDRITRPLASGDVLVLCSDGLYNVLDDREIAELVRGRDAAGACRALVGAANERGTLDNVTAAVVRATGAIPAPARPSGLARLGQLFRSRR